MPIKYISDPVHGLIPLDKLQLDLLALPELQRLAAIKQLSFTYLVYPGGHNTRLEHSVGASHLAERIADALNLPDKDKLLLKAAALLHDIGHGPFSHAVEPLMPKDHMVITRELITGKLKLPLSVESGKIPEVLAANGLEPEEVAAIVCPGSGEPSALQQLIHGAVDVDQLDFLPRDAYYTNVRHGDIGLGRIIQTLTMHKGELAIQEKGVAELEQLFEARRHMYSQVYLHHIGRIANLMLLAAMTAAKASGKLPADFYAWTDDELLVRLREFGEVSAAFIDKIKFRQLFKRAFVLHTQDLPKHRLCLESLQKLGSEEIGRQIAEKAGIDSRYVLIDFPTDVLRLAEPRMQKVRFNVLRKSGELVDIMDISPVVKTILATEPSLLLFGVYAAEAHREKVRQIVAKEFFGSEAEMPARP